MRRILISAAFVLALGGAVHAGPLEDFARLSWSQKVKAVSRIGGQYRRDCAAVLSGQRGVTQCFHITEAQMPNGEFIEVRATMDNSAHQWCVGDSNAGKMVCFSQETGSATTFVLLADNTWHSVN